MALMRIGRDVYAINHSFGMGRRGSDDEPWHEKEAFRRWPAWLLCAFFIPRGSWELGG